MNDLPEIIELKGYTPKPGDVLFVRLAASVPVEVAVSAKEQLEARIPGVTFVVLSGDITIETPS